MCLRIIFSYPHHITNKKRKRAHFTLVIAYNDEGELRPFATNIQVENPRELFSIYKRRWQIETNIRSTRHPFLINTTSLHMPIRDYLMRIAVICCFAWMVINTFMINEYGYNYWITIRMFIVLLFNKSIDENPEKLKKAVTKAPLSAQTMERELSLTYSNFLYNNRISLIIVAQLKDKNINQITSITPSISPQISFSNPSNIGCFSCTRVCSEE